MHRFYSHVLSVQAFSVCLSACFCWFIFNSVCLSVPETGGALQHGMTYHGVPKLGVAHHGMKMLRSGQQRRCQHKHGHGQRRRCWSYKVTRLWWTIKSTTFHPGSRKKLGPTKRSCSFISRSSIQEMQSDIGADCVGSLVNATVTTKGRTT